MIKLTGINKHFDNVFALKDVSVDIEEKQIFGLIGTNGAGKSTLLRIIAGVYKPDSGSVLLDDEPVFENTDAKFKTFYISDDQYFLPNSSPVDMLNTYKLIYPSFDEERFYKLCDALKLDPKRKINTFSKGMKKQLSVIFGVSANTKYLLCDETFDGLDPVIRQAVKRLFINEMEKRDFTPIIASHNLRELEDICDHVGLLYDGGIILSRDLDEMQLSLYKVQCVLKDSIDIVKIKEKFNVLISEERGSMLTVTIRGNREEISEFMDSLEPIFWEILPLSLEEIFICETEVLGYDFEDLIN